MNVIELHDTLNSASRGLDLARQVLRELQAVEDVDLDFSNTDRMTLSFSNAFVMTVCAELLTDELPPQLHINNAASHIQQSIERSVELYQQGIRLSTQRVVAIP